MKQQSELSKMSKSFTKSIVDNVNNVLGILPKTMSFEVSMPKKSARHRKIKAKARHKNLSVAVKAERSVSRGLKKAKRAGKSLKKRAKTSLTKARKAAPQKAAPHKAVKRRSHTVVALKRKPVSHTSHARAA